MFRRTPNPQPRIAFVRAGAEGRRGKDWFPQGFPAEKWQMELGTCPRVRSAVFISGLQVQGLFRLFISSEKRWIMVKPSLGCRGRDTYCLCLRGHWWCYEDSGSGQGSQSFRELSQFGLFFWKYRGCQIYTGSAPWWSNALLLMEQLKPHGSVSRLRKKCSWRVNSPLAPEMLPGSRRWSTLQPCEGAREGFQLPVNHSCTIFW